MTQHIPGKEMQPSEHTEPEYPITPADEWKITFGMLTIGEREIGKPMDFTPNGCPVGEGIANQNLILNAPNMQTKLARLRQDKAEMLEAIERTAAYRSYAAGLGAGEWEAFLKPHEADAIAKAGKES